MSAGNQSRGLGIGAFWFVVLAGGCVGFGPGGRFELSFSDPPGRSPYLRSLDSQDAHSVGRLGPEYRPLLEAPDPEPTIAERISPTPTEQFIKPVEEPVTEPVKWELTSSVAETSAIDELFLIRLRIHNTAAAAAEDVAVTVQFDEAWRFPGSSEHAVRQSLGRVEPDETRELAVSLTPVRPGRQCFAVTVHADGDAVASSSNCTMVQRRLVDVQIAGPSRRTVGSRAEYVVTLANLAGRALPDVMAELTHDPRLTLKEVSAGAVLAPGRMTWSLGELRVDERVQIQVEFSCDSPTDDACLTAVVRGEELGDLRAEKCLKVAPRGDLDVHVSDESDPAEIGDDVVYYIALANRGDRPMSGVTVQLTPTEQMRIYAVDARSAGGPLAVWATDDSGSTRIEISEAMPRGATWTLRIRTRAESAGVGQMIALLKSDALAEPMVVREFTVVNPRPVP